MVDSARSTKSIYIATSSRYWRLDQNQRGRNELPVVDAADAGAWKIETEDIDVVAACLLARSCY